MSIKKSYVKLNIICILIVVFVGTICSVSQNNFQVFALESDKAYVYNIEYNEGFYFVSGEKNDGEGYFLTQDVLSINEAIKLIDNDRLFNGNYSDATINFKTVNLGNDSFYLSNGKYTLKGNVSFSSLSNNACITINNSSEVNFEDCSLKNNGISTLVCVKDESKIVISSSNFTSVNDALKIETHSFANIQGANITSSKGYAIYANQEDLENSLNRNILIDNNSCIFSESEKCAVFARNMNLEISYSVVRSAVSDYAIENNNGKLTIVGSSEIIGRNNSVCSNTSILLNSGISEFSSRYLTVFYSGELGLDDIVVFDGVTEENKQFLKASNAGYTLMFEGNIAYLTKNFRVYYNANCADESVKDFLPTDNNSYVSGSVANILYMSSSVRSHFEFVGYGLKADTPISEAITNTQILVEKQDINLYAIWEPITYIITYVGLDGATNSNLTTYNYAQSYTLSYPEKQFYTFLGWRVNGDETIVQDLTLPYNGSENVELEACFELTEYQITYENLSDEQIKALNLVTFYTIESESLSLGSQNYLINGYSFYGIQTPNGENLENVTINFGVGQPNSIKFNIGDTLDIVVKNSMYYNGTGDGTKSSPFEIEDSIQFTTFLTGEKLKRQEKTYVVITKNLTIEDCRTLSLATLSNFNINFLNNDINLKSFNCFETGGSKVFSIFPRLKYCEILNLNLNSQEILLNCENSSTKISGLAYIVEYCYFENISNNENVNVNVENFSDSISLSAFFDYAFNSIINNCNFGGNLSVKTNQSSSSIYLDSVLNNSINSVVVNSKLSGSLKVEAVEDNSSIFVASALISNRNSVFANSVVQNKITITPAQENKVVVAGLGIDLTGDCSINNCFINNSCKINGECDSLSQAVVCWVIENNLNISNCYVSNSTGDVPYVVDVNGSDSFESLTNNIIVVENNSNNSILNNKVQDCENFIQTVLKNNSNFNLGDNNLIIKSWSSSSESKEIVNPVTLVIKNNVNNNKKTYIFEKNALSKGYTFDVLDGYLFEAFYLDENFQNKVDSILSLSEDTIIYAKYQTITSYYIKESLPQIIISIILLILLVLFVILCEQKKTVKFIVGGRVVKTERIKCGKDFTLPTSDRELLWFTNSSCSKVVKTQKLPLVLFTFKLYSIGGDVGEEFARKFKQKQCEQEKQKEEAIAESLKKKQEKITIKKEANSLSGNDGIVIVKKEIRTINNSTNNPRTK